MTTTPREEFEVLAQRLAAQERLPTVAARRALRVNRGISLRAAARAVGVSATALAAWESGQYHPRGETLGRYLDLLDLLRSVEGSDR